MEDKNIDAIAQEFEQCKKERDEYLNGWKRAKADYLNQEKEFVKERQELLQFGTIRFVLNLLPLLDSFEALYKNIPAECDVNFKNGIENFKKQIDYFCQEVGIKKIETIGQKVNLAQHEIVEKRHVEREDQKGAIIEEAQPGYTAEEKVLRSAKVVVGE
ncbi:MAG: nucleotide exchange factor GrpE [Parcubacteria group bacterium]|nr:nucleotide exchange factor GrpE [Parcubacteria group bacterium]